MYSKKRLTEDVETTNTTKKGDYVVKNPTGEEYVLTKEKFAKNYYLTPISLEDGSGFLKYENKPDVRKVIEVTQTTFDEILESHGKTAEQAEFRKFMSDYKTMDAEKSVTVQARVSDGGEEIVTRTKNVGHDEKPKFKFKASWGEFMILKVGDFLVINDSEVYRIGKLEFEETYKLS